MAKYFRHYLQPNIQASIAVLLHYGIRCSLALALFFFGAKSFAQDNGFAFGLVNPEQLASTSYLRDSAAAAVVIREFGEAYISDAPDGRLMFEHHYLVKILKPSGLQEGNIVIPLQRGTTGVQLLVSIRAAAHNLVNNKIETTEITTKDILTTKANKSLDEKKITIPNVQVGTIIEVFYTVSDPFFFYNFHPWRFQSHLPKVSSEYWATIPGNYIYNITWRGHVNFTKNESEILKECYSVGATQADCARYKFAMENIPAFKEEPHMTARANFVSGIYFELAERRYLNGRVRKVTKEWKDADREILTHYQIGEQLKKGKDIVGSFQSELNTLKDPLEKAKRIYALINTGFTWNRKLGTRSLEGIKKAWSNKTGTIADINLSLIAALQYAGIDTELALLSTRSNGVPTQLHPVITDFNYVVAKVNINGKSYLADASDPYLPFGMLPFHCLNGKARVFPAKSPSYWYDTTPAEKFKVVTVMNLTLDSTGLLAGTIDYGYYGYYAHEKREALGAHNNPEEYMEELEKKMRLLTVTGFEITGINVYAPVFTHNLQVEMEAFDPQQKNFSFMPFLTERITKNPFQLAQRTYPVDFGAVQEHSIILNLSYPDTYTLLEKPGKIGLTLPAGGGKFLFDITDTGTKAIMTYSLVLNRPVYTSAEYHSIKEMFNRVALVQTSDWIFQKKN